MVDRNYKLISHIIWIAQTLVLMFVGFTAVSIKSLKVFQGKKVVCGRYNFVAQTFPKAL